MVELFTSQGCSSCPPADKILGDLAKDPDVIALSMPIDYWDYLGWKDTLADSRFSARQKAYSQMRGDRDVYTPQVIVNGSAHVIGSDRAAIDRRDQRTRSKADGVMSVPVSMTLSGKQINVSVAASKAPATCARRSLDLLGLEVGADLDRARRESRPQVTYHNVVRNWLKVGDWNGTAAAGPCRWKTSRATASMPRWSMSRTAAATSPARCSARPSRRCTEFRRSQLAWMRSAIATRSACSIDAGSRWHAEIDASRPTNEKGPTFVGPVSGLTLLRTGPIPTAPGGWGLRNPEPKGPGQRRIVLSQPSRAGGWRK